MTIPGPPDPAALARDGAPAPPPPPVFVAPDLGVDGAPDPPPPDPPAPAPGPVPPPPPAKYLLPATGPGVPYVGGDMTEYHPVPPIKGPPGGPEPAPPPAPPDAEGPKVQLPPGFPCVPALVIGPCGDADPPGAESPLGVELLAPPPPEAPGFPVRTAGVGGPPDAPAPPPYAIICVGPGDPIVVLLPEDPGEGPPAPTVTGYG